MSAEFRPDLERLANAGQPMRVQGEFGGVATCPVCGASLVLAREADGSLRVPEHDSCRAGGGRLVPVSDSPASGYRLNIKVWIGEQEEFPQYVIEEQRPGFRQVCREVDAATVARWRQVMATYAEVQHEMGLAFGPE